ncbi:hypothetical protein PybrP1_011355 [[Pythium] brassicae (nom. inval.)]|nr:hypothetical protein PybrP1_011355 [[Pythium] brassicae (nom. inval.)]
MVKWEQLVAAFAAVALLAPEAARARDPADRVATAVVALRRLDDTFFGSSAGDAGWGGPLPSEKMREHDTRRFFRFFYASGSDERFGCASTAANVSKADAPFVLVLDRGHCEYAEKAFYAQQRGAAALLVTDTLEQVANRTLLARRDPESDADTRSELLGLEFSCANGRAEAAADVSEAALYNFSAPGWAALANVSSCTDSSACKSGRCVPTGVGREVCCVWDVPDAMGFGSFIADGDRGNITIPALRLKIADGERLKELLRTDPETLLTFYKRDPPTVDPSQFIIWLLAVAAVLTGGYKGAQYERTKAQLKTALVTADATSSEESAQARVAYQEHEERALSEDVLDLTIYHAVAFLVVGSGFLLLIFYVNVVLVVIVGFAIGAVSCTFQELWGPLLNRVKLLRYQPLQNVAYQSEYVLPALWTVGDMLALAAAVGASLVWFLTRHANYSWVFQDVFGICFCMVFLKTVRLPNLKIATVLLLLVFVYDVFMVFLSPLIFKESVMIKAATGGNQAAATASSGFCLRYPDETAHKCVREQMPILLRMPKFLDWREGYAMLGLGDIVLPGLLLVFCARYDYATRGQLYGKVKPHIGRIKSFRSMTVNANGSPELDAASASGSRRGLFGVLVWGYAIGLFLANLAVVLMKEGQPALMYLVPCTLGPLCLLAWRRGILSKLWAGPPELQPGFKSGVVPDSLRAASLSVESLERGSELDGSDVGNEMVLMMDSTPVSTSYARSDATPNQSQRTSSSVSVSVSVGPARRSGASADK